MPNHISSTCAATALLGITLLLSPFSPAHAFSYEEHCRLSNRAFLIAAQSVRVRYRNTISANKLEQLNRLTDRTRASACAKPGWRTRAKPSWAYGDHVARVDWALNPADFFLSPIRSTDSAARRITLDAAPVDGIASLVNTALQSERLLKENPEHFGPRAVYSFHLWHQVAMERARAAGRDPQRDTSLARGVSLALVYNAFADHYLEDLFAPGHVASPREGLNDAAGGGMHNYYNKYGAEFYASGTAPFDAYLSLLDSASTRTGGIADDSRLGDAVAPSLHALYTAVCKGHRGNTCAAAQYEGQFIRLYGDDLLTKSPRQELYVTLVIARSVEDVLDAWLAPDVARSSKRAETHNALTDVAPTASDSAFRGHFAALRSCGYRRRGKAPNGAYLWEYPDIVMPFGHYVVEKGEGLVHYEAWPTIRVGYETRSTRRGYMSATVDIVKSAWLGDGWFGALPGKSGTSDRSTHWGLELRAPTAGPVLEDASVGFAVRQARSFNRINTQTAFVWGGRVGERSAEVHAGGAFQLGFALVHLAMQPGVAWRPVTWGHYRGPTREVAITLQGTLAFTPPITLPTQRVHKRTRAPKPARDVTDDSCPTDAVEVRREPAEAPAP